MPYCTDAQIIAVSDALAAETDFAKAVAFATTIVNSRLAPSSRFAVPYADGSVPDIVQIITADLAASYQLAKLYQQSGADDQLKGSLFFERRAMDQLKELVSGEAGAPAATAADLPPSSIITDPDSASMKPVLRDFDLINVPDTCGRMPFARENRRWF